MQQVKKFVAHLPLATARRRYGNEKTWRNAPNTLGCDTEGENVLGNLAQVTTL
jgi:hypothetical protein